MSLRVGLYVPTWPPAGGEAPRWPEIRALARDVEALGVDSLWVADEPGFWESWTILAAVSEATSRIEVGPLVACTRYRDPGLLVTMARALDEVSAGRLVLGLGSGFGLKDPRWARFGWGGTSHVSRFAEAVEIVARMLRSGPIAFEGHFYQLDNPGIGPAGPRPDGPPIWVAAGKPRTLEIAARWADAVNFAPGLTDRPSVERLVGDVRDACVRVGRSEPIRLTGWARLAPSSDGRRDAERSDTISGTAEAIAGRLLELHDAGIEHLTCFIADGSDDREFPVLTPAGLERFGSILELLRGGALAPA
jgi:alkanesulfonate monooxygenase SsuD/methylene tetrahydromethanopterin reductase-like flavin-dependent oxidoreductase (luciferase family)